MATMLKLKPINARRGEPARIYALPAGTYWAKGNRGENVSIEVSNGPYGFAVRVHTFGGMPLDLVNDSERDASIVQYRTDPTSMAFRRWYRHEETAEDVALLGPEYQRKSS